MTQISSNPSPSPLGPLSSSSPAPPASSSDCAPGPPGIVPRDQSLRDFHQDAACRADSMADCCPPKPCPPDGDAKKDCDSKKSDSDSKKSDSAMQDAQKRAADAEQAQKIMQSIAAERQKAQLERHKIAHEAQKHGGDIRLGAYYKRQDAVSGALNKWSQAFNGG